MYFGIMRYGYKLAVLEDYSTLYRLGMRTSRAPRAPEVKRLPRGAATLLAKATPPRLSRETTVLESRTLYG